MNITNEDFGIDPRERDHAESLQQKIAGTRRLDKYFLKMVKRNRMYAMGRQVHRNSELNLDMLDTNTEFEGDITRINIVHSTYKNLMPALAAKNPECAVSPTEAVGEDYMEFMRRHARTAEIYNNWAVRDGDFKKKLRRTVLSSLVTAEGWMKVVYQRDYREDAMVRQRLDDEQDNLAQLERLIAETGDDVDDNFSAEEINAKIQQLQETIKRLEEQVEVQVREGFVFGRCMTDDIIVDGSLNELEDYTDADWITEQIWLPFSEAVERTGFYDGDDRRRLQTATRYTGRNSNDPERDAASPGTMASASEAARARIGHDSELRDPEQDVFLLFQETWHKADRTVYTTVDGMPGYARQPFSPRKVSKRWYPYFQLAFNDVDGRRHAISETELIDELQDEYNENRSALRNHRNKAVPAMIGRRGDWSEKDARRFANRSSNEMVLIDGSDDTTKPISASYAIAPYPPVDPALYDVTQTRIDIDQMTGVQDAQRGALIGDKTATEAAIMQEGSSSRTQDRIDRVETFIGDIFQSMYELALQEVSYEQVSRIAGRESVWPGGGVLANVQLTHHDLSDWIQVEIRAGSTGRPNKQMEQQNWLQLFPLLQQTVPQILQLRAQSAGMPNPMADALEAMLKELMRRFDERIDLEMFLGGGDMRAMMPNQQLQNFMAARGIQPGIPPQAMQMLGGMMGGGMAPGARPAPRSRRPAPAWFRQRPRPPASCDPARTPCSEEISHAQGRRTSPARAGTARRHRPIRRRHDRRGQHKRDG